MKKPDKIVVTKTPFDWALEVLGLLALAWCFYPLFFYAGLPEQIPTHFNLHGQPDQWGGRATLWLLPMMALAIYSSIGGIQLIPQIYNLPAEISEENRPKAYRIAVRCMREMKLAVALIFGYIGHQTYSIAIGHTDSGLGGWFILVVILGSLVPPAYMVFRLSRL